LWDRWSLSKMTRLHNPSNEGCVTIWLARWCTCCYPYINCPDPWISRQRQFKNIFYDTKAWIQCHQLKK
jgi:hypothetical protein